jgi:hypothetical protein
MAVKLMRTCTAQVQALAKLQRGGEQTVRVVHVHSGGRAVVGTVVAGNSAETVTRGGVPDETDHQPHAKGELSASAAAPLPPLRSEDPGRQPVPITLGAR